MANTCQQLFTTVTILVILSLVGITSITADEYDYCCKFETDALCDWTHREQYFIWSGVQEPDLNFIDDFDNSNIDKYEWVQSPSAGSYYMSSPIMNLTEDDVLSIDLYRHTTSLHDHLIFQFLRLNDLKVMEIAKTLNPGWSSIKSTCHDAQCCIDYPCAGFLQVNAEISMSSVDELLAFTNIIVNNCTETTPTVPPTNITPTDDPSIQKSFCNHCESMASDWTYDGWQQSSNAQPDWSGIPQFTYSSNYVWSQNQDGSKLSSPQVTVDINDTFSFQYYVYSSEEDIANSLIVHFRESVTDVLHPLTILQDTNNSWTTLNDQCTMETPCCDQYPCSGTLVFESSTTTASLLVALDNLELNSGCINSAICCKFEVSDICGMMKRSNESDDDNSDWFWSGENKTDNVPESEDGEYLWWEVNIETAVTIDAVMESQLVTLYPNSSIFVDYYANVTTKPVAELVIAFHRQSDDLVMKLQYVSVSSGDWANVAAMCVSTMAICCDDDENGCAGWIQLAAVAYGTGATVFAVDNIHVDDGCNI